MRIFNLILFLLIGVEVFAGNKISGKVTDNEGNALPMAKVLLEQTTFETYSDESGFFSLENVPSNTYTLVVFSHGFQKKEQILVYDGGNLMVDIQLSPIELQLKEVVIQEQKSNDFGISYLNSVEGTAIYASKKNEVILIDDVAANKSTNNSRQVFAKVSGLSVWESDPAGLQLGIGSRGLNPNRTSNFNTRQNGYDISADALGYPESYYTPPTESLERIEVIRGAASLQYGPQFGGLINFIVKKGHKEKPLDATVRQTVGSYGFLNSFVSLGGTKDTWNYYGFVQHKQGNGWRENSDFNANTGYISVTKSCSKKLSLTFDYTYMYYLSQQAGGLTDKQFEENPQVSYRNRNWFNVKWNLGSLKLNYVLSEKTYVTSQMFGLLAYRNALGELGRIDRPDPMDNRDLISGNFKNFGNETRILHRYNLIKGMPSVFLLGARYYNGNTLNQQGEANDGSGSDFYYLEGTSLYSDYRFSNKNIALFSENMFTVSERLSITPGVRMEYINTSAVGEYRADVLHPNTGQVLLEIDSSENKQSKRNVPLLGIGSSYKPNSAMESYFNFSQNYRAINFSDIKIVNPNYQVDSKIKDESGWNADLGLRGKVKNYLAYDLTLFCLMYDNRIGTVMKKDTITYQTYMYRTNVGQARNAGVESFVELDVLKAIGKDSATVGASIFSNVSYINAEYISSMDASIKEGNRVEYVPEINVKTGVSLVYKKVKVSYQFTYVGEQFSEATNAEKALSTAIQGKIPAYKVSDLSFHYSYKRYGIDAGVNNLFNQMYYTRRATSYPGPGIIPADGRNYYLTLEIKLG